MRNPVLRNPILIVLYSALLLPSWYIAFLMYRRDAPFQWVSPYDYARHSRSTFNCVISIVLWCPVVLISWTATLIL